jgi:hypothetical protein
MPLTWWPNSMPPPASRADTFAPASGCETSFTRRNEHVCSFSEPLVHDMETDVSVYRVTKGFRHSGKDLKSEGAPQPDRRRIGFDNRIELHRPVAVCARPIKDVPAQSPACALTAPRRMDNKAGIGNVCSRARVNGISACAPDDASAIIHGDNGAARRLSHPPGPCSRFGSCGVPGQGLAFGSRIFQDRPDSEPVLCRCLTYHHVGKHGAADTLPPRRVRWRPVRKASLLADCALLQGAVAGAGSPGGQDGCSDRTGDRIRRVNLEVVGPEHMDQVGFHVRPALADPAVRIPDNALSCRISRRVQHDVAVSR